MVTISPEPYTVIGTLFDRQTIILDQPVSLPKGRVRVTVELLPPSTFWVGATVAELAEAQGIGPVQTLDDLWGDFWPEDESVDEFIETVRQWRQEELS